MKKFFTLIMGMLLLCSSIWARTPEEAAAIASGFMSQKGTQENVVQRVRKAKSVSVAPTTVSLEYTQLTPANENAVYVFNHADDGFVLVSAMDESREVLGYSDSGRFDKNDIPENMQFWLQMYASELARADVNKPVLKSGQTAMKRAPKTPAASYPVITPILGNVMWGQDKPYNNLCPVVNGERSVTGCVATAISQIMYVHKHPIKGTGSHSYTSADGVYASANFGSTTYDWNNMLPIYSNNYNTTQANAVATLMYHVGVSADMAYSPDGSGATSSIALTKMGTYFSYDKGIKTWPKDFLTEEEILSAVANDLSIGHPVYLSGATKNDEGHAFVCDGMKSDGYLHINWGWDGVANGYFVLSALDPESQGTGGSASDMAFTERVVIYTGIQPDQGGEAEPLVTVDAMTRTSADVISRNSKVSFSLNHFASAGMGTAKGTVCYYIYDTNDNLVKTIGITTFELETGYYYTNPITTSVAIPSSVANGEYKIEIGYTDDEGDIHPILVKGKGVVRMPMTISNSSITFGDASGGENTGLKAMSVIDVINQNQSNTWQIDLYSENFWEDTPSETDVLIRLTLNSSNPYSIVGSYVLDGTGSAGSISSALYAEGYYHACYQYAPEDMHLTITVDANGALQLQYCMVISGVELKGSATINVPNWYIYINETYYYYQSYITYDLSATIPASKALAMTQTLSHTDLTEMSYFVEGRISSMRNTPEQIASFGTARFDISDDGTTKEQFYCYNTKWINNSSFVTGTEVALGDDVVVYGQLQNYLGTTPEMKGYVYQHTSNSNSGSSTAITYELNGGVTNDYGWMSKNDMFQACMADAGVTTLASLEELKAAGEASLATICTPLGTAQCQAILDDEKWDWLEAYIMNHQNADAAATVLTEGAASAGWRYAIAAFFLEMQRASWPKSADFSQAGKVEAFQPAWQHGFANPTEPTAEFVLNAPYKEGSTFDGWFAAADFSGEKVKTVNAETTGTLYAKWIEYVPTIAEVKALADDSETKVAGVVNFISGKNVYIQDATGGILLYVTETPDFHVGDKIIAKGVKVMYGGAPEVKNAVVESSESSDLFDVTVFEDLSLLLSDTEFAYFGTRIAVNGVKIVSYDSYNNPTVEDLLGNQAVCYKMVLDPVVYPVGTKVNVTAVAAWYNGFQFVGDVSGIEKVVAAKQDNYIYPVRDNKYSLVNDWVISNMEGNFAANKPGNTDMVRGMAAKDGILYFIDRGTASIVRVDGNTGEMLDPIKIIGEHLFEVEKDGEWVSDVMLAYNDIKFDQAGNCLIGACISASATCQTFFIYTVDLETGVATELIKDVLWDNPGLDSIAFRFDAFGVAGDVTKNGVIMAADANGSWNTYRWLIKDGVAGEGEQVAILLDPFTDQSLYINATGFGTAPQILPLDEEGSLFYVDGFNTLPMLFAGNPEDGAVLVDDFIHVPTGTRVTNNEGEEITMNTGHNGLIEFQVGKDYFLLMAATNTVAAVPSAFALYKFANEDRLFEGMKPLWYLPANGMGTVTNGCRTAIPAVEVIDDSTAKLYLYTNNNGYACYTLSIDRSSEVVSDITYELNGGVTNDYGWMSKNDMFQACMADCGVTGLPTLDELKATGNDAALTTICTQLIDVSGMMALEKWDWLEAYIMSVQNADANATVLTEGTTSAGWRYALASFFVEGQRTNWPKSADFSQAGKVEAFQPVWQHGFANPTHPAEDFVLNTPYKPCHNFEGWFATSDFSGEKVTVVNRETIATLYAKWTAIYQETSEELTICYGDSLIWNDQTYTESGEYTVRLADVNGCDSIVTLYLTVNLVTTTEETIVACDSYTWNGKTYTTSGEYTYTTTAANGCDSIVTLHLTINKSEYVEETVTACDSFEWHGLTYTQSGNYTYTTTADQGCERVEVLHLTINKSEYVEETVTACDSYEWHGLTYTLSGDYTYTTTTDQGCERVEVLHLTILPAATTESEELVLCLSELPYEWYGQTLTEAGSYTTSEQYAGMECDSVIHELTVNVYVQTLPATVTQPIVRTGEAIDVTIPTAEIQAHIAAETWYAPNAEVAWYIMEDSDWATLTDEPVVADIKEVVLKYTVETDCDLVESYKMVIPVETTDLEHIQTQSPTSDCQKIFYEDHIYILRNGKLYSIMGQEI